MHDPWHVFQVRVRRVERLSPAFLRVTFTGDDLEHFADPGYDQRIKLVVPIPGYGTLLFPDGPDWYARYCALPNDQKNPIRTYTVRAVRPSVAEVDVDVVLHADDGHLGPAARWAADVQEDDRCALWGPDSRHGGPYGGLEFKLPAEGGNLLLAGDETAVPAITRILEQLPPNATGEALLEVPETADVQKETAPPGMRVTWLPRNGLAHGALLVDEVRAAAARLIPPAAPAQVEDVDVDEDILWEIPETPPAACSVWLAGEAAVVKTLRRHLVGERGLDRKAVAFMGYWRKGRAESI
ncbi:siderophore-interacting protein [Herbidospora daliensis]|uniref:siderophore-interacting protein n=1 Tax=Herbidospora daliensis TaxID=295585 RepID=UPI000781C033|nr:siderophore-interacting protein [Herbidospora daliensis]